MFWGDLEAAGTFNHASALTAAAKIQPIEFQNQLAVPIRSQAFRQLMGDHILSLYPWVNHPKG